MEVITIFTLLILLFSVIIHEVSHGSVAYALGDSTAKDEGRLSLNPLVHIDLVGSILLPMLLLFSGMPIIGWAKPVPINPMNFSDRRWGDLKVSLAGPLSNFIIALIFGLIIKFMPSLPQSFLTIAAIIVLYNIVLGLFNLIPIPPLDGSHILFSLLPDSFEGFKVFLWQYGFILLMLLIFIIPGGLDWIFNLAQIILSFFLKQ
ncbi:MAG: site-2 protease family protein [Candidatus Paceibacterota bacterium]